MGFSGPDPDFGRRDRPERTSVEKVPEEKGMYLTTTIDKDVYCDYWNGVNFDRTELVIAWMPLPLPYEGDSDGTNR